MSCPSWWSLSSIVSTKVESNPMCWFLYFFFWKIKSEIAANVPVTMCSHKQNSTPFSKLTLKPEQPPQEQVCMSNCTGGVCSFLHRCVKVCGSHQLWHNRFSGVWSGSQQLPQIWASACNDTCYSKGKWFQYMRQYQKCANEDYRKCPCNPAHPPGPTQVGFVCFFWNLSHQELVILISIRSK